MAKTSETDAVLEIYQPFLSDGSVSLNSDFAQSTPIKILRDTGASQSLILADAMIFSENTFSVTSVLIQVVERGYRSITFIYPQSFGSRCCSYRHSSPFISLAIRQ